MLFPCCYLFFRLFLRFLFLFLVFHVVFGQTVLLDQAADFLHVVGCRSVAARLNDGSRLLVVCLPHQSRITKGTAVLCARQVRAVVAHRLSVRIVNTEISLHGRRASAVHLFGILRAYPFAVPCGTGPSIPGQVLFHAEEVVRVLSKVAASPAAFEDRLCDGDGCADAARLHVRLRKRRNLVNEGLCIGLFPVRLHGLFNAVLVVCFQGGSRLRSVYSVDRQSLDALEGPHSGFRVQAEGTVRAASAAVIAAGNEHFLHLFHIVALIATTQGDCDKDTGQPRLKFLPFRIASDCAPAGHPRTALAGHVIMPAYPVSWDIELLHQVFGQLYRRRNCCHRKLPATAIVMRANLDTDGIAVRALAVQRVMTGFDGSAAVPGIILGRITILSYLPRAVHEVVRAGAPVPAVKILHIVCRRSLGSCVVDNDVLDAFRSSAAVSARCEIVLSLFLSIYHYSFVAVAPISLTAFICFTAASIITSISSSDSARCFCARSSLINFVTITLRSAPDCV